MSKNGGGFDQILEDTWGCVSLVFLFIFEVVDVVIDTLKKKPETRLRELGPPSHWGAVTVEVPCQVCGASNDSSSIGCRVCGCELGKKPDVWRNKTIRPVREDKTLNWIAISGLALLACPFIVVLVAIVGFVLSIFFRAAF